MFHHSFSDRTVFVACTGSPGPCSRTPLLTVALVVVAVASQQSSSNNMGKGSKGGYYSSGSGGADCDCDKEFPKCPWSMQCWVYASGWFIYVLVLAFATVPQHRYSEDPIVHSGEMRLLDLPTSNPYAYSTSEFSDNLGLVDWYQLSTEPPLLTPTNAAAQNLSARVVVPQIRDTYGFPEQYDWWYQNAWMTPGSSVYVYARCTGAAWINIITGDYAFSKWKVGANGEDTRLDRANWVAQRRYFTTEGSMSWVQPAPSDEIYFTVMKDTIDEGETIDCTITVNLTLIPYDLMGFTKSFPASRLTREIDSKVAPKVLLVAPIPAPGRPWFDIGCHIKQQIPPILTVGPLMGLMFGGMIFLIVAGVLFDWLTPTRECCKEFSCKYWFPLFYCYACSADWGCCQCECCNIWCCCDDWCCRCNMSKCPCNRSDSDSMHSVGASTPSNPMHKSRPAQIELRASEPVKVDPTQNATPAPAHHSDHSDRPKVGTSLHGLMVVVQDGQGTEVSVADRNAGPSAPPEQPSAPPASS